MGGNPLKYTDPQGLFFWDILDFGFFAQSLYNYTQCSNTDNAINLALDGIGLLPGIPALGMLRRIDNAVDVTKGISVLGKFPDYLKLSNELGAKHFSIPTDVWNKMSKAEQWAANQKFLDRMIKRGDDIFLSNPVKNIDNVSGAFLKELEYLIEKGFKISFDGTKMVR